MTRILSIFILIVLFFFGLGITFTEAKMLPKRASFKAAKKGRGGSQIVVSAKLRGDRRAVNVYFANLNQASSVAYTLSYQTGGKQEGIGGSIDTRGVYSTSRELVFGTASGGVYRYHSNITNARLEVVTTLKSGKKAIRRFRIKV